MALGAELTEKHREQCAKLTSARKATADDVRDHYNRRGCEVLISAKGKVNYRPHVYDFGRNTVGWKAGKFVSDYLVDDAGIVHLT
ncbi:hypothetical protein ACTGJ9_018380 [Bradyrhizobium sp. RDM12]